MIEKDCPYKIDNWSELNSKRTPRIKCKQIKGLVKLCVKEQNCEYVKEMNRIIKKQMEMSKWNSKL